MPGQWVPDGDQSFEFIDEYIGDNTPNDKARMFEDVTLAGTTLSGLHIDVLGRSEPRDIDSTPNLWTQYPLYGPIRPDDSMGTPSSHLYCPLDSSDPIPKKLTPSKMSRKRRLLPLAPAPMPPYTAASRFDTTKAGVTSLRPLAPKPVPSSIIKVSHNPVLQPSSARRMRRSSRATTHRQTRHEKYVAHSLEAAAVWDRAILDGLSSIHLAMGFNMSQSKSHVDMYITALRQVVRSTSIQSPARNEIQREISIEGVLWAVREAWPSAEGYYNMTATLPGFLATELWRNFPCERTYRQLPPAYRPTRAQLVVPHPPNIDWLPWPDVRDLAIRYQDSIDMDALFRMAIHNVVVHRKHRHSVCLSEVTSSLEANDNTSFRVWDLICSEKANGTEPLADPSLAKKAVPKSPRAKAVIRAYDLEYDRFETQKLDDGFFEAFPCLYAESAASNWRLQSLNDVPLVDVGNPAVLSSPAVSRLQARIKSLVSANCPG